MNHRTYSGKPMAILRRALLLSIILIGVLACAAETGSTTAATAPAAAAGAPIMTPAAGLTTASAGRLSPDDLAYRGAFALPEGDAWLYAGHALAYYPAGDPAGPADGFPGSLYVVGHAHTQHVGEIGIPAPALATDLAALPRAPLLRQEPDITGGHLADCVYYDESGQRQACEYREVAGLAYLPTVEKIAWNLRDWYNVGGYDLDSLGWSDLDMRNAQGVWHIGTRFDLVFHNGRTSGYLFTAPAAFAEMHLSGRWLLAGNQRTAGAFGGSQGPALFALAPWAHSLPPAPRAEIEALALLYYPEVIACLDDPAQCGFPGYRADDIWGGGAWVTAGDRSAALFFGRKGLGANYYGDGRPGDCSPYKGWHSDPYQPQVLFYHPDDLAAVAVGNRNPWEALPYATYTPDVLFDPACGTLSAVACDSARRLIYATETHGETDGQVVVHVWEVIAGAAVAPRLFLPLLTL